VDYESTSNRATNNPRRICHLAYTFYESDSRVIRYAECLAERGDEVEVVALRRWGQSSKGWRNGVRISRIQRRSVNEKRALGYLIKILYFLIQASYRISVRHLRKPYKIVHVHNVPDFLVLAAWLPKLTGAKVILDIHDILPELFINKFNRSKDSWIFKMMVRVEKLCCRFAHHIIIANDLWRERLISRGVAPKKCTTLLNYPDKRIFKPVPISIKGKNNKFIVLYPGTLSYHQGLDLAVCAFAQVYDQISNAEFHIYGEGTQKNELKRLIERFDLGRAVLLKPLLQIDEIATVIAKADLGIVPKRGKGFGGEAFSTKILEFMFCGVPLLVARTTIDDYYFNEQVVEFFEPGNLESLASTLVRLIQDRDRRNRLAEAGYEFSINFSWEANKFRYLEVIGIPELFG